MRLKQIKLAGFKSFVEPTSIPIDSQLVAIVGPNGCGKSNLIDAVKWVLGESSAKNLRGESMADVIFNGSAQRKPVGQASVELTFDNSLGRFGGQYASFQDIAVKRLVTRDGDSAYFLNGTRCRRRDITDLFLGTGAGSRGYSIIGQGTISRIIEAKPEEMRAFLEEAAGISKYKQRRKETVQHIANTRENLARVADIRDELEKQLQRLERQAKAAERYQQLKKEERQCKAEILALKWEMAAQQQETEHEKLAELTETIEQHQQQLQTSLEQQNELKITSQEVTRVYQATQTRYYQLATEIARLEEIQQQQQRDKARLKQEQQKVQSDWQTLREQIQEDTERLEAAREKILNLQENGLTLKENKARLQTDHEAQQQAQTQWLNEWERAKDEVSQCQRQVDREQVRVQQIRERRQDLHNRLQRISEEVAGYSTASYEEEALVCRSNIVQLEGQLSELEAQVATQIVHYQADKTANQTLDTALNVLQTQYHQQMVERATLKAQLTASLPPNVSGNENQVRLMEQLEVEPAWQLACAMVLGQTLHAVVLDTLEDSLLLLQAEREMAQEFVRLYQPSVKTQARLSDKIKNWVPGFPIRLDNILIADHLDEARVLLPDLNANESIVTSDGFWLGPDFLRAAALKQTESPNLLAIQARVKTLDADIIELEAQKAEQQDARQQLFIRIQHAEQSIDAIKQQIQEINQQKQNTQLTLHELERQIHQQETNRARLLDTMEEHQLQLEELASQLIELESNLSQFQAQQQRAIEKQVNLEQDKESWRMRLAKVAEELDEARQALHQHELQWEREQQTINQLSASLARDQERLERFAEQLEIIALNYQRCDQENLPEQAELVNKKAEHQALEQHIQTQQAQITELMTQLQTQELSYRDQEAVLQQLKAQTQTYQLKQQEQRLHAERFKEQIAELQFDLLSILASMKDNVATLVEREQVIQKIADQISRLGAINLAAIEEHAEELSRKQTLDNQYDDLTNALLALEQAMEKLDKETRSRLQTTFDAVNQEFQAVFPRLFGGGRAMLELTCDNLLEAGIIVFAQPPGKRNSTIHLLSGGEKAMTAVALVFALFQLNPSPFCMLDEVDAPLDDVNVGRFCALVKEMSPFVQFLFISHNKITMELADHLIGVTMREPGVSRVVAVDVEQALAMVEAS